MPVSLLKFLLLGTGIASLWGPKGGKLYSAFSFSHLGHSGIHCSDSSPVNPLGMLSVPEHVWPEPVGTLIEGMMPIVAEVTDL